MIPHVSFLLLTLAGCALHVLLVCSRTQPAAGSGGATAAPGLSPCPTPASLPAAGVYQSTGVRKAVLLARYVDLLKDW